ncbi:hypothetical protein GCM10023185_13210 [Hymenobacter saemangeumensis]|uniref:Uncharacterized protein n=1 Tax=Hymenobacter saemangeumensis TaxID=1084522 RepID=A0ABP8I7T7_9BACT
MATKKTKAKPAKKAKKPRKAPFKMSAADAKTVRGLLADVRKIGLKYRRRGKQLGLGL